MFCCKTVNILLKYKLHGMCNMAWLQSYCMVEVLKYHGLRFFLITQHMSTSMKFGTPFFMPGVTDN